MPGHAARFMMKAIVAALPAALIFAVSFNAKAQIVSTSAGAKHDRYVVGHLDKDVILNVLSNDTAAASPVAAFRIIDVGPTRNGGTVVNLADSLIVLGTAMLLYDGLFGPARALR